MKRRYFIWSIVVVLLLLEEVQLSASSVSDDLFLPDQSLFPGENHTEIQLVFFPTTYLNLNLPFKPKDVLLKEEEGGHLLLTGVMATKAIKSNLFSIEGGIKYFEASLYRNSRWQRFSIEDRLFSVANLDHNFFQLLASGNSMLADVPFQTDIALSMQHLFGINYSWQHIDRSDISLILTAHLYFGKAFFNLKATPSVSYSTFNHALELGMQGRGRVSMPLQLASYTSQQQQRFSLPGYLLELRNPGVGIDADLRCQINDRLTFFGGVHDLGGILWNSNTTSFKTNTTYTWSGTDISGDFNLGQLGDFKLSAEFQDFKNDFLDRLIVPEENSFLSLAPLSCYGNITYVWTKNLMLFGAINLHQLLPVFQPVFGGGILYSINNNIHINAGYLWRRNSWLNLPVRISADFNNLTVALGSDDIVACLLPGMSKTFGGSISCSYRFDPTVPKKMKKLYKDLPFFQPLKRGNK